ncbi:oxidoreductase [Cellulomonas bogoriensis 69B4 = DSM 16987]|uniref:Oxidoreductase n=1 Tax=Cellulomonas bogoriensis 69B4 = DSM 16987 TaxID=1386082 RepID=A0A0A0BYX8_9CELL|nr:oxidoreductase [Cellulomonas bogoriensis 69B4 = DSM 16987]
MALTGTPVAPAPPLLRRWWGDAVRLVVGATVLAVVCLWAANGGVTELTGDLDDVLTSVGHLSGLVSANLLLLQVLSMARLPWAERSLGQDRLVRWHRFLGVSSIALMLVHVLAVLVRYTVQAGPRAVVDLVMGGRGMLAAVIGTVLLLAVAASSVRRVRRRLRYEHWHLLHLYAYLGAGLALPHQLLAGADFLASPVATVYWWTLWAGAAVAVLTFRVVVPIRLNLRHRLRVAAVWEEGPGVVSIRMTGRRLTDLRVAAGQFFVWRFRTGAGWTRGHPFSLSAVPTGSTLRVTINVHGDDGERLARLQPGTPVLVEGPYGRLTTQHRTRTGLAFIGSGMGVAPLISVLQDAVRTQALVRPATFVRRLRNPGPHPLDKDLFALQRAGWVRVVDVVGPRTTTGSPWLPTSARHVDGPDALRRLVPDLDDCDLYVCGASPWVAAVASDARAAGVPADALHAEHFAW